jgi:uncharacterized cupin superfamily protein
MTEHQIVSAVERDVRLELLDLPVDELIAGDPRPREWSLTSEDSNGQKVISGIFEADPGTIRGPIDATVTVYVLKGHVRIELDTGDVVELGVGDIAILPRGPVITWTFTESFRELFVMSGVGT